MLTKDVILNIYSFMEVKEISIASTVNNYWREILYDNRICYENNNLVNNFYPLKGKIYF
jgi:hypothetical protein